MLQQACPLDCSRNKELRSKAYVAKRLSCITCASESTQVKWPEQSRVVHMCEELAGVSFHMACYPTRCARVVNSASAGARRNGNRPLSATPLHYRVCDQGPICAPSLASHVYYVRLLEPSRMCSHARALSCVTRGTDEVCAGSATT